MLPLPRPTPTTFTLNPHYIRGRPTRVKLETRVMPSSVIDLVMTNKPELIGDMIIADEYDLHSDHLPILVDDHTATRRDVR